MTSAAIARPALAWIVLCQIIVVLPHLTRVPWWILTVYVGAAFWRFQVLRSRVELPARSIRFLLGVGGAAAIVMSYGSFIGLEPMVGLLLVASALKVLEAVRLKDGYVLVCLSFFVCTTEFLFSQSLPVMLYSVFASVMLVTALILLNQRPGTRMTPQAPWLAVRMLALAVPMMVVLFVLFPRIGPLWSVPSKTGQGTTGMSDVLRPGEVSKLGRSADVAFRVRFDGDIPPRSQMYWRGMVLNRFDDGAWRTLDWRDHPASERRLQVPEFSGSPLSYQVIMEPTLQRWLYALPYAESETTGVLEAWDYRLMVLNPIESQFGYRVNSWSNAVIEPVLSAWRQQFELALPEGLNPRTRLFMRELVKTQSSPESIIAEVLRFFRTQPFYYTLTPSVIDEPDFVDRFVFESRRGFCEHYAYAFVVMMRMAGIPARIVGGYQGGETNPLNNTVVVRQFDAHAWAEVWLSGRGWTRVDPTAAVSPARVELGLEAALSEEEGFLADSPLSAYRFRGIGALNWLRLRYDALAWQWQSFIVGFNSAEQLDLLKNWFGEIKVSWFVAVLLGSWVLVLAPLTWFMARQRRPAGLLASERDFVRLRRRLQQRGLTLDSASTPNQWLEQARVVLPSTDPLLQALERSVNDLYRTPAQ